MSRLGGLLSPIALATWATTLICAALLVLPGVTASSMYFNDILIFLDGGYRVVNGQVPNQDFHTALGPLNFYLPGLGYWLTDSLGMAMPVGMTALMLITAPIMIHVLGTRLRPMLGVPLAIFLVLLLATPMNTGEIPSKISFAMFYNRIGWVLLGVLLVLHLEPNRSVRWQGWLDAAAAATLTMLLIYTKMTYGVVALSFLAITLLQPAQRGWAAGAIALCVGIAAGIEGFWGGTQMHIADLVEATKVSGVIESYIYVRSFMRVSGEYVVFALIAGLALWHRPRITDVLFYCLCGASGFALINQNFQHIGIITMLVGSAVAAEVMRRHQRAEASHTMKGVVQGAPLAVVVLLLPIALSSAAAVGIHAVMASARAGVALETAKGADVRVVNIFNKGQFEFYERYAQSLGSGAALLASLDDPLESRVLVMDFVSPFASLAGLPPQDGGNAWMHDERNFDMTVHLPPEEMLGGVDVVMVPKFPVAEGTTRKMQRIYGDYLGTHFELTRETGLWLLYQRRPVPEADLRPSEPQSS